MRPNDKAIADILDRYEEPFATSVWRVQGQAVIFHKALERIAVRANVRFDLPTVIRSERDEAVILVVGRMPNADGGERVEWSVGEALINVNYRVSGKQAAYVYAMAEKRAKDRVILKLIELHGLVYSEDEADDFKRSNADREPDNKVVDIDPDSPQGIEVRLRGAIDKADSVNAVTDLMLDSKTQADLAMLAVGIRDEVREHAKSRLRALGWPAGKGKAQSPAQRRASR